MKHIKRFKHIKIYWPFRVYRLKEKGKNFLDICLEAHKNAPWGWEWGYDNTGPHPFISVIIGHFKVLYFEKLSGGFEFWFMGFWLIK